MTRCDTWKDSQAQETLLGSSDVDPPVLYHPSSTTGGLKLVSQRAILEISRCGPIVLINRTATARLARPPSPHVLQLGEQRTER